MGFIFILFRANDFVVAKKNEATKQVLGSGDYRVLGAQTTVINGREVHIIKVLTPDGRIQYFKIDAETGAVIG